MIDWKCVLIFLLFGISNATGGCQEGTCARNDISQLFEDNFELQSHDNVISEPLNNAKMNQLPIYFTIMLWVMHIPSATNIYNRGVIVSKDKNFEWAYDAITPGYQITLKNSTYSRTVQGMLEQVIVYNKWLHLSLINSPSGLYMYLNWQKLIMHDTAFRVYNGGMSGFTIGFSSETLNDKFSGVIHQCLLFSGIVPVALIPTILFFPQQVIKDKYLMISQGVRVEYIYLYPASLTSGLMRTSIRNKWIQLINPLDYYREDLKTDDGNGISSPIFTAFFSGKSFIKLKNAISKQSTIFSIGLWFNFMKFPTSSFQQTLLYIPECLNLQYFFQEEENNYSNFTASVNVYLYESKKTLNVPLPNFSGVWRHLLLTYNPTSLTLTLEVSGFPSASIILLFKLYYKAKYDVYLGIDNQQKGFTGMMRSLNFYHPIKAGENSPLLLSSAQLLQLTISSLIEFPMLQIKGYNDRLNSLSYRQYEFFVDWREDYTSFNLCPKYTSTIYNFSSSIRCCKEAIYFTSGVDAFNAGLRLPLPINTWTSEGTFCIKILISSISSFSQSVLFTYGNFNVTLEFYSYQTVNISVYDGTNLVFSNNVSLINDFWNHICIGFKDQSLSTDKIFYLYDMYSVEVRESSVVSGVLFTPGSGKLQVLPSFLKSNSYIVVKDVLLVKKLLDRSEFEIFYSMHPELIDYLQPDVIAFWPLNESGDFVDPINDIVASRNNTNETAGISSANLPTNLKKQQYVLPSIFGEEEDPYFSLQLADIYLIPAPFFKASVDFSDIIESGYVNSRLPFHNQTFVLLGSSMLRPSSAVISRYHGLGISNPEYAEYVASISEKISQGFISIWFNKKDLTEKVLLSGFGGLTPGTQFSLSIGTNVKLLGPTISPASDSSNLSSGSWIHMLILWNITTDLEFAYVINGGTELSLSVSSSGLTEDADAALILGAKLDGTGAVELSSIFEGYIRRVEVLNINLYNNLPFSFLSGVLSQINRKLITSSGCDSSFNTCSFCDIFSMKCFTTASIQELPDHSGFCPSSCIVDNLTSCDSTTRCSGCNLFACISCFQNRCVRCKNNLLPNDNGICECPSGSVLNSSSLTCHNCATNCASCLEPLNPNLCLSCKAPFIISKLSGEAGNCVLNCPYGMEPVSNVCQPQCDLGCKTCSEGLNQNKCTSCFKGSYLLSTPPTQCVPRCPDNALAINDHCETCDEACRSCQIPHNASACYSCSNLSHYFTPLYPDSLIGSCSESCQTDLAFADTVNMICHDCPISTYQDNDTKQCLPCHERCFGCSAPLSATSCLGCNNKFPFLKLNSIKDASGECGVECGDDEDRASQFVCVLRSKMPISIKTLNRVTYISYGITLITLAAGIIASVWVEPCLESVVHKFGNLQVLFLLALVNSNYLPKSLKVFFESFNIVAFKFIPNIITALFPIASSSVYSFEKVVHPGIQSTLFLNNIGNVILLIMIFALIVFILKIIFPSISVLYSDFIIKFVLIAFCQIWMGTVLQLSEVRNWNCTFELISVLLAGLTGLGCVGFLIYTFIKLRKASTPEARIASFIPNIKNLGVARYTICFRFILIKIVGVGLLILFLDYVKVQLSVLCIISVLAIAWDLFFQPYNSKIIFIDHIIFDLTSLCIPPILFLLPSTEYSREQIGTALYMLLFCIICISDILNFIYIILEIISYYNQRKLLNVSITNSSDLSGVQEKSTLF